MFRRLAEFFTRLSGGCPCCGWPRKSRTTFRTEDDEVLITISPEGIDVAVQQYGPRLEIVSR